MVLQAINMLTWPAPVAGCGERFHSLVVTEGYMQEVHNACDTNMDVSFCSECLIFGAVLVSAH